MRNIKDDGEVIQEAELITVRTVNGERVLTCDGLHLMSSGVAYVMNEAGRTVAKYELGPPLTGARAVNDLADKFPDGKIRDGVAS